MDIGNVFTEENIKNRIIGRLERYFGIGPESATRLQMFKATALTLQNILAEMRHEFWDNAWQKGSRQVYYMSLEFLMGRSLKNHVFNLQLTDVFEKALTGMGFNFHDICSLETDAGLGNGGLGRLAACYMDSLATVAVPVMGYSIRYEFGIFKQKLIDGWQAEFPDTWLDNGDVWLIPRTDEAVEVHFDGRIVESWENDRLKVQHLDHKTVLAIPYDMMVSGFGSKAVNVLRLWAAKSPQCIDMALFSRGEHLKALEQNAWAEAISSVLYPADDNFEGKSLRLKQQYFMVSASVQDIIARHMARYGSLMTLPQKIVIHINDTHPALVIPELMRILMDQYGLEWEAAWGIVTKTVAYTNHTVMSEALETWPKSLFAERLPRIYRIIEEINRRFCSELYRLYPGNDERVARMAIIGVWDVRMANLSLVGGFSVNGVSKLHTEILCRHVFKDFNEVFPGKFRNITNGIAYRRWLCQANPELAGLLDELIGTGYRTDAGQLKELLAWKEDRSVLSRLAAIKLHNKERLAAYIEDSQGIRVDPRSVFDVQVKRLHEYKRQLMNIMHVLGSYDQILEDPSAEILPRTFIFAAKASPGYFMAKQIIRLISCTAQMINNDPRVRDRIKVVFLEDYRVTLAEMIMPAAEVSEQISTAGREASGTGNMKLMINGALTLGTLDGANIEIMEAVGPENMFIFGLTAEGVENLWQKGYAPSAYYQNDERIRKIADRMKNGISGVNFGDIAHYLLAGRGSHPDPYMCIADYDAYQRAQQQVSKAYLDRRNWNAMSLVNIACAGGFSADRSVRQYAREIWGIDPAR